MSLSQYPDLHTTIPHIPNRKSILSYAKCGEFPTGALCWREILLKGDS